MSLGLREIVLTPKQSTNHFSLSLLLGIASRESSLHFVTFLENGGQEAFSFSLAVRKVPLSITPHWEVTGQSVEASREGKKGGEGNGRLTDGWRLTRMACPTVSGCKNALEIVKAVRGLDPSSLS